MQDLLPYITGSGGALVVLAVVAWALATGHLHSDAEFQRVVAESEQRKDALETERTVSTELARTGGVANQLIGALVEVATDRSADRHPRRIPAEDGLTAHDLGL